MFRPAKITHPVVVNDGKPFEAFTMELSFHINDLDLYITNYVDDKNDFIFHQSFSFNTLKELQDAKYSVQWQLAQALNPPIKVTQAVLKAMEKAGGAYSAKSILINAPDYSYNLCFDDKKKVFTFRGGMTFDVNDQNVPIYTVQADCPLALQVLLGFTTEGVPKDD
jgi:hypothetical protein